MGGVPPQLPVLAVSVSPSCATPVIVGTSVETGGLPATRAVALESAAPCPATFVAVTSTLSFDPTSPGPTTYVEAVAPATLLHVVSAASHRRHWYASTIGVVPFQTPGSAASVWPSTGVPETAGGVTFEGGTAGGGGGGDPEATTTAVGSEVTEALPY